MHKEVFLSSPAYALGESIHSYEKAQGFDAVLQASGMPNFPALWGWGSFHETADITQLAQTSAAQTLAGCAIDAADIDLVIVAAAHFSDSPDRFLPQLARLLQSLGCTKALLQGHTLNGCAGYLSAIRLARERVQNGELQNVLVIGLGSMPPDMQRFTQFALFGDAACSCLISAHSDRAQFRVLDTHQQLDLQEMASGVSLDSKSALQISTLDHLLTRNKLAKSDLQQVLSNNLFLPVKKMKDARLGFSNAQLFNQNISRIGHCHVCDSLINLVDYMAGRDASPARGEAYLLQSDGSGHSACVLLSAM